jgi:hypothetical protein
MERNNQVTYQHLHITNHLIMVLMEVAKPTLIVNKVNVNKNYIDCSKWYWCQIGESY